MATSDAMKGKVVLVTGANSGIGKAAAEGIAAQGATTVLLCRSKERGEQAVKDVVAKSGNQDVHLVVGDLASQADIRRAAADFKARFPRLDVLVNNAGVINGARTLTVDGLESTFALNHLGYFLLTHELLDLLKQSAPSRIVNLSSGAHAQGHIHFDDLQLEKGYSQLKAYGQSKLANILFTRELAKRLEGTGVTVNCMHPGVVATGFGTSATGLFRFGVKLIKPFMLTDQQGADTAVWLATSPDGAKVSGEYFYKRKVARTTTEARDMDVAKRLWEASEKLVGIGAKAA